VFLLKYVLSMIVFR